MSVAGLSFTQVNVYSVVNSQDVYGANFEQYYIHFPNVKARIMYLEGQEDFIDGKEMVVPIVRIYIPEQLDILESDLMVDCYNGEKYDIININDLDYRSHMQIDCKMIDQIIDIIPYVSSSSSESSSSSYYAHNSSSSSNSSSTESSSSLSSSSTSSTSSSSKSSSSESSASKSSRSSESSSSTSSENYSESSSSSSTQSSSSSTQSRSSESSSSESSVSNSSYSTQSNSSVSTSSTSSSSTSSENISQSSDSSSTQSVSSSSQSRSSNSSSSQSSISNSSYSSSSKSSKSSQSTSSSSTSSLSNSSYSSTSSSSSSSYYDDYYVSGNISPDATGKYVYAGYGDPFNLETNNYNYWTQTKGGATWYLTDFINNAWNMNIIAKSDLTKIWSKETVGIIGNYEPEYATTGTAEVDHNLHSSSSSSNSSSSSSSSSSIGYSNSSSISSSSSSSSSYMDMVYVSGDALPDAEGDYSYDGLFNGTCSYHMNKAGVDWYIYWQPGTIWRISAVKGNKNPYSWSKVGAGSTCTNIYGTYTPTTGTQGSLTVYDTPQESHSSSSSSSESSVSSSSSSSSSSSTEIRSSSSSSSSSADTLYVTGDPNPDCKGTYTQNGTYGGYPAYERLDGAYWICWVGDNWWIDPVKGSQGNWYSDTAELISTYSPNQNPPSGNPTVSQT